MDPVPATPPPTPINNQPPPPNIPSNPVNPNASVPTSGGLKKKIIIIVGIVVVLLIAITLFLFASKSTTNKSPSAPSPSAAANTSTSPTLPSSDIGITYGTLTASQATIKSYDLQSKQLKILASLPSNVKKITPLLDGRLLFINKTDKADHGEEIALYNTADNTINTLLKSAPGYGIDDYVLSPNQQFLATWEVKFGANSSALKGGFSRVYSFSMNNPNDGKNLIYNEDEVTNPSKLFHYPRAINDLGEVFCDSFLPNSGAGWAFGLSVSDLKATKIFDLSSMKNGTYSTQPVLSPDGNFLAFAGYDGSKGDGTAVVAGFRQALLSPNTIELLNLKTKERDKLSNLSNQTLYGNISWDKGTNSLIYGVISGDANVQGNYLYNLQSNTPQKISTQDKENKLIISSLSSNLILLGNPDLSPTVTANLGQDYSPSFKDFSIYELDKKVETPLDIKDPLMQFINVSIVKKSETVLGTTQTIALDDNNLQLKNYVPDPKPDLNENRGCANNNTCITPPPPPPPAPVSPPPPNNSEQPVTPPPPPARIDRQYLSCEQLGQYWCLESVGVSPDAPELADCVGVGFQFCPGLIDQLSPINGASTVFARCIDGSPLYVKACLQSPLYLYGPAGKQIAITINTPTSNSNVSGGGKFNVVLNKDGKLNANGQLVNSLTYDYKSALRKITAPKYGRFISTDKLPAILADYAKNLNLSNAESEDLIQEANKITSPYVFVSFFDQETSKNILPISFDPKPDTYINLVFYFKQLDTPLNYTPIPPTFETTSRGSFTAVEISEIIE